MPRKDQDKPGRRDSDELFNRALSILTENFKDVLVIARCDRVDGSYMRWHATDPNWASGAMERFARLALEPGMRVQE